MEPKTKRDERIKRHAEKGRDRKRRLRLIVTEPGVIDIEECEHRGHLADLIEAPAGTKIERPKGET